MAEEKEKTTPTESESTPTPVKTTRTRPSPQKKGGRFTAVYRPLRHPKTQALYRPGVVTEALELDNWLRTQIEAGLIKRV